MSYSLTNMYKWNINKKKYTLKPPVVACVNKKNESALITTVNIILAVKKVTQK